MKRLFVLVCVLGVGWGMYERFGKARPAAEAAFAGEGAVLQVSNPALYGTMESGGPVLRMKPETLATMQQFAPGKVVMFATSWCPYCAKARELFARQGVRYTELNIEADSRAADFQKDTFGSNGVPLIVTGNRVLMGWDEGELLKGLKEI